MACGACRTERLQKAHCQSALPSGIVVDMYLRRRGKVLFISTILLLTMAVAILKSKKRRDGGISNERTRTNDDTVRILDRSGLDFSKQISDGLNVAIWEDMCGFEMLSLKAYPLFPHGPTKRLRTSSLRMRFVDKFENFGLRIFGFLTPFESGNYNFYLASTGSTELWMSLDSKPEHSQLICNVTSGVSWKNGSTFHLNAGERYYLEILHKQGEVDDDDDEKLSDMHLKWQSSTWKEHELRDIPSNVLSPFEDDRNLNKVKSNSLPSQQLSDFALPMHIPRRDPSFVNEEAKRRAEMYRLPFISEEDTRYLFRPCSYSPSYLVKKPLERYQATWENHYTSIYPFDYSDVVHRTVAGDFVNFGNDQMNENTARAIVSQVWMKIQSRCPG